MELPKWVEDIAVLHEGSDGAGETLPDGIVDALLRVEPDNLAKIIGECVTLASDYVLKLPLISIRGVESDPEKDECGIGVIGRGFCSTYPTNGTMHAQPIVSGKSSRMLRCFSFKAA